MKKIFPLITLAILQAPILAWAETQQVEDFALIDHQGGFHQLSQYANRDAMVIFIQANGDDVSRAASAELETIRQQFTEHNIEFLMLNPMPQDNRASVRAEAEAHSIGFPILIDAAQSVAESLGVTHTGEVFVINPKNKDLIYRGPISVGSQAFLQDSLQQLLAGQTASFNPPAVEGKVVAFPHRENYAVKSPSYQHDIAPILERRCVACHQEGGLAPWAMSSYDMVRGWAPMIRETVITKRMPPGQIDNFNLNKFVNVHHITPQEQAALLHWIEAGAPKEGKEDPLVKVASEKDTWELGKPDLIVDVPEQQVPATGVVDYLYIPVELNLTENKWLRAYEFNIGDKSVMHHIIAFSETKGKPGRSLLGGYGPGKPPRQLPEDTGVLLTPDTRFVMQIHYTTNGKATVDRTKLALYFSDEKPTYQFRNDNAVNFGFTIPPNVQDFPSQASITLRKDTYLYSFSPHMHFRGKRMDYTAVYPDGKTEWLINIPNYRFDWQMDYELKEPKFLPAGTKIVANGAFDNSEMNAFNPDPSQEVKWGEQTWEEMFIGFVGLAYADGE